MEFNEGVGAPPDGSASAGSDGVVPSLTPPVLETPGDLLSANPDETIISDPVGDSQEEPISDELQSEIESVIEAQPNDSALVKKLRDLLKVKYEDFSSRVAQPTAQEPSENQKLAEELVNGLFEFDLEKGPTTQKFAHTIAKKDIALAQQVLIDLANTPMDDSGFTIGHKFLEQIGLDPYKIEELRQFSQGQINPVDYGIVKVHDKVPQELSEAYKSLSTVQRTDVDLYLDSENPEQLRAALATLKDRQTAINSERQTKQFQEQQQQRFTQEVTTATESDLETTYSGVLTALRSNPAYTNIAVSSDPNVDSMVKDSIIAQLNALGDPRSVLAQQAVKTFEARGVKVDLAKVGQLMQTIENSTQVAISADRMGKLQGRDYSTQIQEALARKSNAVSQLVALGNRYFSQALSNLTGVTAQPNPKGSVPNLQGKNQAIQSQPSAKPKNFQDLDKEIAEIARSLQAAQ